MRRAIWMALALGTAPLVALAQQTGGAQAPGTQASPSGAGSLQRGQDTTGLGTPGAPGQQSAGSVGTAQGQPATGGAGVQGAGGQQTGTVTGGGDGTGAGGGTGGAGPTYRGTTPEIPSATPPVDVGTRVGPEPGEQAAAQQPAVPQSPEAMQRELSSLRQRVDRLEREVGTLRGTGGGGAGDTGTGGTADIRVEGPVTVATAVFDGRVRAVTRDRIDIVDASDGSLYQLRVDRQTKAFRGPQLNRIRVSQLSEGTPVRASFALISGEEVARNIVTQPQQRQDAQRQQQQRREQLGPGQRMVVPPAPQR